MRFEKETRIAAPPAVVFAFHESPGALERLTPPWERVELVQGGDSIRPGARVVLRVGVWPLRMRWVAEHTEYEKDRMFADRQVEGPFDSWYHRHICLDDGDGGTRLRDEIEYQPPFGIVGRWLVGAFIQTKLRKMFDHRHEVTRRISESGALVNRPPGDATDEGGPQPGRPRDRSESREVNGADSGRFTGNSPAETDRRTLI